MEPFRVHVLGCGSAKPTTRHFASSQLVEIRGKLFMIDCGEGTQIQLRRAQVRYTKLNAVFISHLHGDHCFGLIGLICSLGLSGRTAPFHVYAPGELEPVLRSMMYLFAQQLEFEVLFHAVDTRACQVIYEDKSLTVTSLPLNHRVPCSGFLFREKPTLPHIRRDMIDFLHIPVHQIINIKRGGDWVTNDGTVVPHERLVLPADPPRAFAYCSDTRYMPELHRLVAGANLIYHESTYDARLKPLADKYFHSTATEAAMVARDANARHLLLGHYSARYSDETLLLDEAKAIFPNTTLANEGLVVDVV